MKPTLVRLQRIVEKLLESVKCGLSSRGSAENRLTLPQCSFCALKYDVRHAALVEASKNEIKREQNEGEKVRRIQN